MKLHFEPNLEYQKLAIESIADLFRGQEVNRTEFTVTRRPLADRSGQQRSSLKKTSRSKSTPSCRLGSKPAVPSVSWESRLTGAFGCTRKPTWSKPSGMDHKLGLPT